MGAAPNAHCQCGAQWLLDIYTMPRRGVWQFWKHLEPVVHPASAGKHWWPRYLWEATAPPYAAAIQFWGREPDPPKSGSSSPSAPGYSTLLRAARVPLQPSNCCLHLEWPPQSRNGIDLRKCGRAPERHRWLLSGGILMIGQCLRWPRERANGQARWLPVWDTQSSSLAYTLGNWTLVCAEGNRRNLHSGATHERKGVQGTARWCVCLNASSGDLQSCWDQRL